MTGPSEPESDLRQIFDRSAPEMDQRTLENMQRFAATLPEKSGPSRVPALWKRGWFLSALSGSVLAGAAALFMIWSLDTKESESIAVNALEANAGSGEEVFIADASEENIEPAEEDQLGFGDPLGMEEEDDYEDEAMLIAAIYDSYLADL